MAIDMTQFYQVFFEETGEHLAEMERLLLELDKDAPDLDALNAIFRAAHSIKGGAGTFGFQDMTEVTHHLETLLDRLRKAELQLREEMVDAFLCAGDVLRSQLEGHQHGSMVDAEAVASACAILAKLASESDPGPSGAHTAPDKGAPIAATRTLCTYTIRFSVAPEKFAGEGDLSQLLENLSALGALEVVEAGDPGSDTPMALRYASEATPDAIREIFAFFTSPDNIVLTESADAPSAPQADDAGYGFFDEAPGAPAAETTEDPGYGFFVEPAELKTQMENARGYGFFTEIPPKTADTPAGTDPATAGGSTATPANTGSSTKTAKPATGGAHADASSIRVSVEKVDQLINLVGELVITHAMLAQTSSSLDPVLYESLMNGMSQLERNTRDLQESVMSIRMMPISFVFSRFPRVVRDLAGKLNKQVEFRTVGEGTELDKGLIEKIADPLNHLVRNSLDHGIESPETRIAAGKDPKGVLTLRASHEGGNVVIVVEDDGGGLSREKILSKARERGLPVHDSMSDQDVWQLIFAPGFSTAEAVTDVSGRGVGMDVVKRNIEGLGGRVEIDSATGFGTKITIRLPLTLAILDGMSVALGNEVFIIPLTAIVESFQPNSEDVKTVSGQGQVVQVRGEYLPLVALHEVFGVTPRVREPHQGILVIIAADGRKAALFVDELVGQHQVVIKSLENNYRRVSGIAGATIMGDGRVALILDVAFIGRFSER